MFLRYFSNTHFLGLWLVLFVSCGWVWGALPDSSKLWSIDLPGDVSLRLAYVEPGRFEMGSSVSEMGRFPEEPRHTVTLTQGFWLGVFEVTQQQWEAVMLNNPSTFKSSGLDAPVEEVSWEDAMAFCESITHYLQAQGEIPEGAFFTLPTEAQWEYACRAGTQERFNAGDTAGDLARVAWYRANADGRTHVVGQKEPNAWGFYDMHGNVWEWCLSWKGDYPAGNAIDPTGPPSGAERVMRGGSISLSERFNRSANRYSFTPDYKAFDLGFRIMITLPELDPIALKADEPATPLAVIETPPRAAVVASSPPDIVSEPESDPVSEPEPEESVVPPDPVVEKRVPNTADPGGDAVTIPVVPEIAEPDMNQDFEKVISSDSSPRFGDERQVELSDGSAIELVYVGPGRFRMGSPNNEAGRYPNERMHDVTISRGFWLGRFEVTQGNWKAIMGNNPSGYRRFGSDAPVEKVTWEDAVEFCARLTQRERDAGRIDENQVYTLPTEAQWEYAARAGSSSAFSNGNVARNLGRVGWFRDNSRRKTHPVGELDANAWGFYDMHGNVWEWTLDWYAEYPEGPVTDPKGPSTGSERVFRGGAWSNDARFCRSAVREKNDPAYSNFNLGFRLALIHVE